MLFCSAKMGSGMYTQGFFSSKIIKGMLSICENIENKVFWPRLPISLVQ